MKNIIKNTFFLFTMLFSGLATDFYRSPEGVLTIFILAAIMMPVYKIGFSSKLFKAIFIWLIYAAAVGIITWSFNPFFILRHVVFIFTAYVIIKLYEDKFFYVFEKTVYYLSIIGLIFWFTYLVDPDPLISFAKAFDISGEMSRNSYAYYNFLIYTIEIPYFKELIMRNRGFTFEPGPYSIYLALALTIYILRGGIKKGITLELIVLIVSLISTFATTGLIALGATLIYLSYANVKGVKKYFLLFATSLIFIYAYFTVDIFSSKIEYAYEAGKDVEEDLSRASATKNLYSGGRFGGFIIGWNDFKKYPLLGIGGSTELSFGRIKKGVGVYIVNGIASIMSMYGLFGLLLYFYYLFKSSSALAYLYRSKATLALFILITISSFSFSLHVHILLFATVFFYLFHKKQTGTHSAPVDIQKNHY